MVPGTVPWVTIDATKESADWRGRALTVLALSSSTDATSRCALRKHETERENKKD